MLRSLADNPASTAIARALADAGTIDKTDETRQAKLAASVMKRPVTLQFRDANLRMVFEALSGRPAST
jgi:general secretion pathway protein D